jgi:hypothetical protein
MKRLLPISLLCSFISLSLHAMEFESERPTSERAIEEEGFLTGHCLPHKKLDAYSYYEDQEAEMPVVTYKPRNAGSIVNKTMSGSLGTLTDAINASYAQVSPEALHALNQLLTIVKRLEDRVAKIELLVGKTNKHE